MHIRQVGLGALLILTLLLPLTGACDKSTPEAANSRTSEARKDRSTEAPVIARLHWLGKKRISAETNAAYFMTIWNLPESKKLEEQILDKLASAPWRLLLQQTGTSTGSALFRPLLNDLLNEESYLEISQPSNQPGSLVFGIRLDRPRALLWETNLARIMESLTDLTISKTAVAGVERGWMLKKHDKPNLFEFAQIDGWTLLGWSQDQNPLLENIIARIHNEPLRFPGAVSNFWLEASLDLQRSADALLLRRKLPEG